MAKAPEHEPELRPAPAECNRARPSERGTGGPPHHDVHVRAIVCVGLVLSLTVIAVIALVFFLVNYWQLTQNSGIELIPAGTPAQPQLEVAPQFDWAAYAAEKQHLAQSYQWLDESRGLARIPVDVAMQAIVAGGQPEGAEP